jgi:acyl-coenzyme A synthetase/AMP-(fatty) acid ligase
MIYDAGVPKEDLSSLLAFRSGTAPLDPALAQAIYDRYEIPVLQNYGATEFGGGVAGWTLDDFKAHWPAKSGSVGRLNPGVEGRIADGVLELRSRQIGEGKAWLRTTDLARIDEDGFLYILGRADSAIIRGGFKIQPDDIVRAIEAHPAVKEAAVTALPDERLGQMPGAAYLVRAGASAPSEAELVAFLKDRLTGYQVPAVLKAVEKLPRTASMKVDQSALRALLLEG